MARNFVHTSNQRIEFATLSDYTTQISWSCWVNAASDASPVQFFVMFSKSKDDGSDNNISIDYRTRAGVRNIEIYWTQPTSTFQEYVVTTGFPLTNGTWFHIAFAIDWTTNPDSVTLWVDGASQSLTLAAGSNNATPSIGTPIKARIGSLIDASGFSWDGQLAEMAVWPGYLLTDSEAVSLSKRYAPFVVHPAGLETYPQMIREVIDYKGIALTNQGTTVADHPPIIYAG